MSKREENQSAPESSPEEQAWLERLARCAPVVEAWRRRTDNPVPPEHGSSLAADDMEGLLGVESTIWYSMCVAAEHLDFTLAAIRSTSTMYPTAYMSAIRPAIMSAANAVYILAEPKRQERRKRALRMRSDELRTQIVGLTTMDLPKGKAQKAQLELQGQLIERQKTLQQASKAVGLDEDVSKMRFNQTTAINWVASHMRSHSDAEVITSAFQSIWREGSSAAHGHLQYAIMRAHGSETVASVKGRKIVRLRGNLTTDVGPALVGAVLMLNEAFRLYDLRSVKHFQLPNQAE